MKRIALLACLAAGAAFGQLQLFTFDGVVETPVPALYDAGSIAAGDSMEVRFRVRNAGTAGVNLTTISAAGSAFSVTSRPSLPYPLAPGAAADFRVGFAPASAGSYSAVVTVNGLSTILRAASTVAAEVAQMIGGSRVTVPGGATVDLGRVLRGLSSAQDMFLHNPTSSPLNVTKVAVSGEGFSGSAGPLILAAGEWLRFTIAFSPSRAGDFAGTLVVDSRSFQLRAVGYDPPLPRPSVVVDSGSVKCGEQHSVSLRLDSPSPVSGSGTLQIFFDSSVPSAPSDPAVQFLKTGSRSASFTVAAGDSQAKFGSDATALFQTGTTAGTLRFQITISGQPTVNDLSLPLAPDLIATDTISATRRIDALELKIAGFDNTYSAGPATFTFFDAAGRAIAPGAIKADFTADFKGYFATSSVGSAFQMRVAFPVSGDASQISAFEVELTNSVGAVQTKRIALP